MKDRSNDPSYHGRTLLPRSYISLTPGCTAERKLSCGVLTLVSFTLMKDAHLRPSTINVFVTLWWSVVMLHRQEEGRKKMFCLTMHSTHFIYKFMASDMVKDHSDSEKRNQLLPYGQCFILAARDLLYTPIHRQDSRYHSLCYTSRGTLVGTEIAQWVYHKGSN